MLAGGCPRWHCGAAEVARDAGIADIISVDVGGTSCDVCLITGGLFMVILLAAGYFFKIREISELGVNLIRKAKEYFGY